jgi:subtilisin family serine protease
MRFLRVTTGRPRIHRAGAVLAVLALAALSALGAAPRGGRADLEGARAGWAAKLDPFLRRIALGTRRIEGRFTEAIPARSAAALRTLPGFVRADREAARPALYVKARLEDGAAGEMGPRGEPRGRAAGPHGIEPLLAAMGIVVRGRVGPIVSLRVPVDALEPLARLPQIAWVKAGRSYRPSNEISTLNHVSSDAANLTFGTRGAGVIVAVIDTGIDWTNLDFRNADGTTRLLGIWDQTRSDPLHPPPPGFTFGAYYGRGDIAAALSSGGSLDTGDGHGHGSHVMGTAAGNGLQTGNGVPAGTFAGVVPEADLLAVRVFDDQGGFCAVCDLTAAVQFVRGVAAAEGKPWVGNMSLGTDLGAHDGSDPDEQAIAAAAGPGTAGSQIAIAAGNSGGRRIHWGGTVAAGQTASSTFSVPIHTATQAADDEVIWIDLWYGGADRATVTIVSPGGRTASAAWGTDSGVVCTDDGAILIDATNAPDPANGDNEVFVQIWDSSACAQPRSPRQGDWTIQVRGDSVGGAGAAFDAWNEIAFASLPLNPPNLIFASGDLRRTVAVPGTSRHAVTAGAYVDKNQWVNAANVLFTSFSSAPVGALASFSGSGPSRDGRQKPDIAAPGEWVGSSLAGSLGAGCSTNCRERDGQHGNLRGTSMASPHAAGVAALLLAINPDLSGPEIAAAIRSGALADAFTGTVPNDGWGHGKLRAPGAGDRAAAMVTGLAALPGGGFTARGSAFVDSYNIYRGDIPGVSSTAYGTCLLRGLPSPDFTDAEVPLRGGAYFYLTTGVRGSVEGILGTDSDGRVRPNNAPCQ